MEHRRINVLFLSLHAFTGMGGIEKVSRVLMLTLTNLKLNHQIAQLRCLSAYDETKHVDNRYIQPADFSGFGGNRPAFSWAAVRAGINAKVVILSHINMAPVGLAIKILHPSVKLLLIAHGIEIWPRQSFLKKQFLKQCARILAISQFTKDKIIATNGLPAHQIEVLHNTIDPFFQVPAQFDQPQYLLQRYALQPNDIVLFTLTRMSATEKFKGYDRVLQAISQIKHQIPTIKYLLSGKCDLAEQERLNQLIQSLGLQAQVILTGFLHEKELTDHFLLADVFTMPSKKEGFGIVFIEALACGLIVVAGNKDGSVDAVKDNEGGLLVDPDSTEDIRQAILRAIVRVQQSGQAEKQQISQSTLATFGFDQYQQRWQAILKQMGGSEG